MDVAVQAPAAVDDADFEQHPVLGVRFLQMEPALCGVAAVRPEDGFPRERLRARERMHADEHRRVDAVEFDRFADRRHFDDTRMPEDRRLVTADAIDPIERPQLHVVCRAERRAD